MNWFNVATLGPIGYLPAPGTCGTIATLLLVYLLKSTYDVVYLAVLVTIVLLGFKAADSAVRMLQLPDPSCVVIDECIGTLITFIALPFSMPIVIVGIILFRFFDITKWPGIGRFQQLPSPLGVIADDIVAGIISCILLHILYLNGLL